MIERLKHILFSPEFTIQERFIQLTGIVGSTAMLLVLIVNIITGQSPVFLACIAGALLVFIAVTYFMIRFHKYRQVGSIAVLISILVVLPMGYLFGGGVFSGSPIWLLIYFIMVFMMFKGRTLVFYVILTAVSAGVTTLVGARYPDIVVPLSGDYSIYMDSYFSIVAVGLIMGGLIKLQTAMYERQNRIAKEQTEEIERMNRAQNTFFSSMSHEIRTPINTIIGLNELTLREENISDEIVENSTQIQEASKMLLSLINDILDLSKIDSEQMEITPDQYETTSLLSEIVNLLWNRAREKGLRFDINVGESIPSMLFGDKMRIKQIIVNLLTNAIKYTNEGFVTLNVTGETRGLNEFLLHVEVADSGIGIRKESLPYLFDSFRRVDDTGKSAVEGTGLGLSIAKQLTELMGGTISVDSIYTKGSTFRVEIPQMIVSEVPIDYRSIAEVTHGEQVKYHQAFEAPEARVLIVDDNEMNRVVTSKLLRSTQVKTDLAASGKECLDKTAETHYDAIFMDHMMPEMDGVETLEKIRAQANGLNRTTPVIALTANAGEDMGTFYTDRGFQAYLAKPIHSSLLEATLMQILPSDMIERAEEISEEEHFYVGTMLRKKSVIITADCVCDLPEDMVRDLDIRLMHYYCITEDGRFRDPEEIDADNLLRYLDGGERSVRTESGSVAEYESFFANALTAAESVIHISMSSGIAGSGYDNAVKAADSFANVQVFDGQGISSGIGMIAIRAAELAKAGMETDTILDEIRDFAPRIRSVFLVPHPESTGRLELMSPFIRFFTRVMNFEPVFTVKRGAIRLNAFRMGYLNETSEEFIRRALRRSGDADRTRVFVNHCGCSAAECENVLRYVRKYAQFDEIILQKTSATLSCNCGMHSIGVTYAKREKRG